MKSTQFYKLFILISCSLIIPLSAQRGQETDFDRQLRERDDQPVREFVQSKENIDVKKKSVNLEISGDIRFEWTNLQERGIALYRREESSSSTSLSNSTSKFNDPSAPTPVGKIHEKYRYFRGGDRLDSGGVPLSTNDFDIEFNLKIKYTFKKAWCMAQLTFDNPAGVRGRNSCDTNFKVLNKSGEETVFEVRRDNSRAGKGSGEANSVNLKRAFAGYNVWADGKHRLDIEIGRRKMDDLFDSEIQFSSRFDGIAFKYASTIDKIADWYCNTGIFLIDERKNHFGWATELGILNIFDSGLDVKYSFIDWTKRGPNRCFLKNPLGNQFQNSQISFEYNILPEIYTFDGPVQFYGGFLVNHAARKTKFTRNKLKNLGWYAGTYINAVDQEGDWAIDIEYIYIQAQAVADYDVGGIGRGNIYDETLYDVLNVKTDSKDTSVEIYFPRRGNANFKGWRFEFLYAITDNLSVDFTYELSTAEDSHIGGPHKYNAFEIETIYAF